MSADETFEVDGVEWERYLNTFQRPCAHGCDRGLLLAPARFCPACGGSGYFVQNRDPRTADSGVGGVS